MLGLAKVRASVSQLVKALYVSLLQRKSQRRWGGTSPSLDRSPPSLPHRANAPPRGGSHSHTGQAWLLPPNRKQDALQKT